MAIRVMVSLRLVVLVMVVGLITEVLPMNFLKGKGKKSGSDFKPIKNKGKQKATASDSYFRPFEIIFQRMIPTSTAFDKKGEMYFLSCYDTCELEARRVLKWMVKDTVQSMYNGDMSMHWNTYAEQDRGQFNRVPSPYDSCNLGWIHLGWRLKAETEHVDLDIDPATNQYKIKSTASSSSSSTKSIRPCGDQGMLSAAYRSLQRTLAEWLGQIAATIEPSTRGSMGPIKIVPLHDYVMELKAWFDGRIACGVNAPTDTDDEAGPRVCHCNIGFGVEMLLATESDEDAHLYGDFDTTRLSWCFPPKYASTLSILGWFPDDLKFWGVGPVNTWLLDVNGLAWQVGTKQDYDPSLISELDTVLDGAFPLIRGFKFNGLYSYRLRKKPTGPILDPNFYETQNNLHLTQVYWYKGQGSKRMPPGYISGLTPFDRSFPQPFV